MKQKRRKLYYCECLHDTNTWRVDFLRTTIDPTTADGLAAALLEREPDQDPEELAQAYDGRWVVWAGKKQDASRSMLALVRRQLDVESLVYLREPSDKELDALHVKIAAAVMRAMKTLPPRLRETVEIAGDEPLARIHLVAHDILTKARELGRVHVPVRQVAIAPRRRTTGWGALYRTLGGPT